MPEHVYMKVKSLAPGGAFVGEVVEGDVQTGVKGFVRFAAPGEEILAAVTARKQRHIEAALESVMVPSPLRCHPPCPVFGVCGGCDLQHLNIGAQREAKRSMVQEFLEVQAGIRPTDGVIFHSAEVPQYGYRRRVTLHIDDQGAVGFYEHSSHSVVAVQTCPISTLAVNAALEILSRQTLSGPGIVGQIVIEEAFDRTILAFEMTGRSMPLCEEALKEFERQGIAVFVTAGKTVVYRSEGIPSYFQPGHFSQVNEEANKVLVDFVTAHVSSVHVTDLYAGSGNLSLPLAAQEKRVTAVELDSYLVGIGRSKAKERGLSSFVDFVQGRAEDAAPNLTSGSTVLLDPPRSGAKEVVGFLRPERSPRIVYVSCFLPALARDLTSLVRSGYDVKSVTCIDMFPQTAHVESVAVLEGR